MVFFPCFVYLLVGWRLQLRVWQCLGLGSLMELQDGGWISVLLFKFDGPVDGLQFGSLF